MTGREIVVCFWAWLKERELAEVALGVAVGFLVAGALFTTVHLQILDAMHDRAIENAQIQVADAIDHAHRFRASLQCTAETIVAGCMRYEPRVRP